MRGNVKRLGSSEGLCIGNLQSDVTEDLEIKGEIWNK